VSRDDAVVVHHAAASRRQLAELRSVGPHREDLTAEGVRPHGIAAGIEDDLAGDRVLGAFGDGTSRWRVARDATRVLGQITLSERGQLAEIGAERVDGEELAIPGRVATERIRGRANERPSSVSGKENSRRIL